MLQVPPLTSINGITIFGDDTQFWKFYLIAAAPAVRMDEQGRPFFLLVKYAISDDDRIANPSLPAGGGYMSFDIQFDVSQAELEEVRKQLQPSVDEKYRQLKNGSADAQARAGMAGMTEPPKVAFGTPSWTGGKVSMDAPQAKELASARISEAEPSLLSGNIASFNMDLTPAGASFMQKTLVEPSGSGIDLTPIQVGYDLKFWARLPPIKIHVKADSKKIHDYVHKMLDGSGRDYCTTYEFQHTDIAEETISMTGAIDVQIDNGAGMPDEVIENLRRYSLDMVKEMIQSAFFSSNPPENRKDDSEQPENLKDVSRNSKKYFKKEYDHASMNISFDLEQRSVIEWPIHPQSTLRTFFRDMKPEEIRQHVRQMDLDDDFFKSLQLTVRAFADFGDPSIANVEVQVHYEGLDENGKKNEKNKTFTFVASEPQQWSPSLIGSQREYQYRYRIGFSGQEGEPFTEWKSSKSPDLNIPVANPGKIDLTVLAGDIDFDNMVQQAQVQVAYEDAEAGVAREEVVLLLDAARQEARYQRAIFKTRKKPIQYRARFRMKSGKLHEDETWRTTDGPHLVVNQPFDDQMRVSLLPSGDGWDDVVNVSVELKYSDNSGRYSSSEALSLKKRDEIKTWKVSLNDRSQQSFQYRWLTSYLSGYLEDSGWKQGTGSGTYPIVVQRQGIKVTLLADTLDFATSPLTEVHLRYRAAGVDRQETLTFRDKTPQFWNINAPQGAPIEYTYQVTHYPVGGRPLILQERTERDTVLVIPPYRVNPGKITVQIFSTLVDFNLTPIVTVDLRYDDDENDVHCVGALTFSDAKQQTWELSVKDASKKQFRYRLSYFMADGTEQPQEEKSQESPRIIIPRHKP